jgi:hypothetical protein
MTIQYAGYPIVNTTFTQSAGTRAELATWIQTQLVAAGWTLAVSGTNDYKLNSAITPQNLQMRVRVYDAGTGNSTRIKVSNVTEAKIQSQDHWLAPAVSKVWRFIGNKYQFFVMTPGNSAGREFFLGGVPYLPPFLTGIITECMHSHSNSQNDSNTQANSSFRVAPTIGPISSYNPGTQFSLVNGSMYDIYGPGGGYGGWLKLANLPAWADPVVALQTYAYRWHDLSFSVVEVLLAWGATTVTDEPLIRGQLWDSIWINEAFTADATISFDGRTYWGITSSNTGSPSTQPRGTLFVAVS